MKTIFIVIVGIHACIHLLGFMKAFSLSNVKEFTVPVSKPAGIGWLFTFLLFVILIIALVFNQNLWWLFGLIAIVISELLIISYWKDARYATIINIVLLAGVITGFSAWNFRHQYQNEVHTNLKTIFPGNTDILNEIDLSLLPVLVKKYIYYTGSLGKPKVKYFFADMNGEIRKNKESEWMTFSSKQYDFITNPARLFFIKARMMHLPVAGYHRFVNGHASMDIRLFSMFRVQKHSELEMDTSETVTYFNDMCCLAPATLIDNRIKWLETDSNKVKASFTNNGITIFAWLVFNDKGELVNFISDNRYAVSDDGSLKKYRWSTPLKNYKMINGCRLASDAATIYTYPGGDFCYGTFHINKIAYNGIVYK